MKSIRRMCVTGVALFTLLAIPVRLAAQQHHVDAVQPAHGCTGERLCCAGTRPS